MIDNVQRLGPLFRRQSTVRFQSLIYVLYIHNCIIPFHEVDEETKLKDKAVIVNLPYLLAVAGYKLTR